MEPIPGKAKSKFSFDCEGSGLAAGDSDGNALEVSLLYIESLKIYHRAKCWNVDQENHKGTELSVQKAYEPARVPGLRFEMYC